MTYRVRQKTIMGLRFAMLAAWMGLIFYFSAQNSEISGEQSMSIVGVLQKLFSGRISLPADIIETVIRKLAHFSIYLVLGVLANNSVGRLKNVKWYVVLALCVLYSVSDELHQTYIAGRSGEMRDVFIDSCGALLGIFVFALLHKEKIIVSACLTGVNCRYDGNSKPCGAVTALRKKYRLIPVCPESLGGLQIPRSPSEILDGRVYSSDGGDVTENFVRGAEKVLEIARKKGCTKAVLKERSPSCGSCEVYDGTFSGKTVSGKGITAALLEENGIEVISEENLGEFTNS